MHKRSSWNFKRLYKTNEQTEETDVTVYTVIHNCTLSKLLIRLSVNVSCNNYRENMHAMVLTTASLVS